MIVSPTSWISGTPITYNVPEAMSIGEYNYTIIESYKDRKGNIWYKLDLKGMGEHKHSVIKISNSNQTLEWMWWAPGSWPTEMDTNHPNYSLYYRQ